MEGEESIGDGVATEKAERSRGGGRTL